MRGSGGPRELGGMQAGFIDKWTGAPIAITAGAIVVAISGYVVLHASFKDYAD